MERERHYDWMVNCLPTADISATPSTPSMPCSSNACDSSLDYFKITPGCSSYVLSALNKWSDFHIHISNVGCLNSFGPVGLLFVPSLFHAVIVTGVSLSVSPHQANFIDYQEHSGTVIKSLASGGAIAGGGMVKWHVEVSSNIVPLQLHAVHVPAAEQQLLCPQQILQELFPSIKEHAIWNIHVLLNFPCGSLECPFNQSNLPVIQLCTPDELDCNFKTLNTCLLQEANCNLTATQKELLCRHWKGLLNLARTQVVLKSGVCSSTPLLKAVPTWI